MKITWKRGADFIDNSPRYWIEGYGDSSYSDIPALSALIVREREREYKGGDIISVYYGYVRERHAETEIIIGPKRLLKDVKRETEDVFLAECRRLELC